MGRPATGQTPVHSVRVPPHVWDEAAQAVKEEGETMSQLIVRLLERHNAACRRKKAKDLEA